jgi:hypothetical protein
VKRLDCDVIAHRLEHTIVAKAFTPVSDTVTRKRESMVQ